MCFREMYLYTLQNRNENLAIGSRLFLFLKLAQINCIFTDNVRILYIYWYILYNFWKYLFVKIAGRVLGPDHIVTSLEHLGTVPGVQLESPRHCARCSSDVTICPGPTIRANSFDK